MNHKYEYSYKNVHLRPLDAKDIESLRNWRNSSENSSFLSKKPYITEEMQMKWFESYMEDNQELLFAIEEDRDLGRLVGSLGLYGFCDNSCLFGKFLIGDDEAHGRRVGLNATIAATKVAFELLGLSSVELFVYPNNRAAREVYQQAGFNAIDIHTDYMGHEEITMALTKEGRKTMHNMNKVQMLEFPQRGDERGHLVIVEGMMDIPFEIKRAFYIYGSDSDVVRGQHANRESEFVLINVAGKSKVKVKDGEGNEAIYCLNRPHTGIYLPTMVWKDMYDFSEDSVLLVLASTHYNANEYIRNYEDFVAEIGGGTELIRFLELFPSNQMKEVA